EGLALRCHETGLVSWSLPVPTEEQLEVLLDRRRVGAIESRRPDLVLEAPDLAPELVALLLVQRAEVRLDVRGQIEHGRRLGLHPLDHQPGVACRLLERGTEAEVIRRRWAVEDSALPSRHLDRQRGSNVGRRRGQRRLATKRRPTPLWYPPRSPASCSWTGKTRTPGGAPVSAPP